MGSILDFDVAVRQVSHRRAGVIEKKNANGLAGQTRQLA